MSRKFTAESLRQRVGEEVGVSDWIDVTQQMIDGFAALTGDPQWIHIDVERCRRESPFRDAQGRGHAIAHGFLTLSLLSQMRINAIEVTGMSSSVNYGFNRMRFTGPVPAGSRVRGHFVVAAFEDIPGGIQVTWGVSVELEGQAKPVLVAEWLGRSNY
jgi:acyl dehydratase